LALGALVAYLTFEYLVRIPTGETVAAPRPASSIPPAPRLQVQTQAVQDLNQMRDEAESRLNSYGWSDPANDLVRIPIERALELLLERERNREEPEPEPQGLEVNRE
jgi:hypothetical protein